MELTAEVGVAAEELFEKATKVVFDSGYSQTAVDRSRLRLRINSGASAFSWGEIIEISAEPVGVTRSVLHLTARRKLATNIGSRPQSVARDLLHRIVTECTLPQKSNRVPQSK